MWFLPLVLKRERKTHRTRMIWRGGVKNWVKGEIHSKTVTTEQMFSEKVNYQWPPHSTNHPLRERWWDAVLHLGIIGRSNTQGGWFHSYSLWSDGTAWHLVSNTQPTSFRADALPPDQGTGHSFNINWINDVQSTIAGFTLRFPILSVDWVAIIRVLL